MFDTVPAVELQQRDGLFARHRFRLVPSGIQVTRETLLDKLLYTLPLEVLFEPPYEEIRGSKPWFAAAIVAALASAASIALAFVPSRSPIDLGTLLMWPVVAFLCGLMYVRSRRHWVGHGRPPAGLLLLASQPSRHAVGQFLEQLRNVARGRVRERFLLAQRDEGAATEMQRLAWLRDQEIITQEEFESFKRRVLRRSDGDPAGGAGSGAKGAHGPN
jgi:hypothetical protein